MIKIRLTFPDTDKGNKELEEAINILKNNFEVLNISDVYEGRGKSKYSNVYMDVEKK